MGLDKGTTWHNVITQQRGEDLIRIDSISDLHTQQTTYSGVHGGFPQLAGVHLTQTLVALLAKPAFGFGQQPLHDFTEIIHGGFTTLLAFTTSHHGAITDQTGKGLASAGQSLVIATTHEVAVKHRDTDVAMVQTLHHHTPGFAPFIKGSKDFNDGGGSFVEQRLLQILSSLF